MAIDLLIDSAASVSIKILKKLPWQGYCNGSTRERTYPTTLYTMQYRTVSTRLWSRSKCFSTMERSTKKSFSSCPEGMFDDPLLHFMPHLGTCVQRNPFRCILLGTNCVHTSVCELLDIILSKSRLSRLLAGQMRMKGKHI